MNMPRYKVIGAAKVKGLPHENNKKKPYMRPAAKMGDPCKYVHRKSMFLQMHIHVVIHCTMN